LAAKSTPWRTLWSLIGFTCEPKLLGLHTCESSLFAVAGTFFAVLVKDVTLFKLSLLARGSGHAIEGLTRLTAGDRPSYQITHAFLAGGCIEGIVKIFRFLSIGIVDNDSRNATGRMVSNEDARQNPQG
jgi:hypothetical protein